MNCEQARGLVDPYSDGELEASAILEFERHLKDCAGCALALRNLQSLRKAVNRPALYFDAPANLRRDVLAQLRAQTNPKPRKARWNFNWLTAGMTFATACLAILLVLNVNNPSAQPQLAQEVVSSHIRSLMPNHLMDVVSSDQHTVKPWFDGRVDFAPPVKDLVALDFPLVGGRLDYLDGKTVAALIFRRNKHIINLFVWPASGAESQPAPSSAIQGYNLVHWSHNGMAFWAVSDLNQTELLQFSEDYVADR